MPVTNRVLLGVHSDVRSSSGMTHWRNVWRSMDTLPKCESQRAVLFVSPFLGRFLLVSGSHVVATTYYHLKDFCPILVRRWRFEMVFRSEVIPLFQINQWKCFTNAQEVVLLVHFLEGAVTWSKYLFKLSPPNENGAELLSMTVPTLVGNSCVTINCRGWTGGRHELCSETSKSDKELAHDIAVEIVELWYWKVFIYNYPFLCNYYIWYRMVGVTWCQENSLGLFFLNFLIHYGNYSIKSCYIKSVF